MDTCKLAFSAVATTILLSSCSPIAESSSDGKKTENVPAPSTTQAKPTVNPQAPTDPLLMNDEADPLLNVDLLALQRNESSFLTPAEILQKNEETIDNLNKLPLYQDPSTHKKRISAITPKLATALMSSMDSHPVVAFYAGQKYDQVNTHIGYCFGRATYAHLALLRLGIAKQSIRKAWIVGPMYSGNTGWAFHVATIVRSHDGQWLVVDNYPGRVLELREWVHYFYPQNKSFDNLRLYVTSPQKFSASLSKYDRVQMGLNLTTEEDWYRHYFFDLMKWFKNNSLSQFGLQDTRTL